MSKIAVIGGSGFYELDGIQITKSEIINTPFGYPSDELIFGTLKNKEVVFLPRHGKGHILNPSEVPYRANIWALKKVGVDRIISITACGSLKHNIKPTDFVIIDQFIDLTKNRKNTFFENGIVGHISMAQPICKQMAGYLYSYALSKKSTGIHWGGTYVNTEGPQFSTKAESKLYQSWGADVIGMTNATEAKLAREAEICYCSLGCVTDYDSWHPDFSAVTVDMIIAYLNKNVEVAKTILKDFILTLPNERTCICKDALKDSIITDPKIIPNLQRIHLSPLLKKYKKEK